MGGVCAGKVGTASVSSMLVGEVPFGRLQALGDREASLAKLVGFPCVGTDLSSFEVPLQDVSVTESSSHLTLQHWACSLFSGLRC